MKEKIMPAEVLAEKENKIEEESKIEKAIAEAESLAKELEDYVAKLRLKEKVLAEAPEKGVIYQGRDAWQYAEYLLEGGFYENIHAFKAAVNIAKAVKERGGAAMLVGGGVRDEIMGLPIKDYDLEVYNIEPEELRNLVAQFGELNEVGKAFGILKIRVADTEIDVSLPRRESKTGKGHKDFSVSSDPKMSVKEAARRRDFTINSLAKDILTGRIYDYFGGVEDLKNRMLRVTDEERFKDDPLRVLRAVQFVGRMGLMIEDESARIIREMRPELKYLPKERLKEEWLKLFTKSRKPSLGLNAAMELGIFHELHKDEIVPLMSTPQEPEWHPEGDVWIHTLMVVDEAAKIVERERLKGDDAIIVLLSAFCHDLGKPATTEFKEGRVRSHGHEPAGVAPSEKFLSDIGVGDKHIVEAILKIVENHLWPAMQYTNEVKKGLKVSDGAFRKLARKMTPATIEQLVHVAEADHLGRGPFPDPNEPGKYFMPAYDPAKNWMLKRAKELNISKEVPAPLLQGRDLVALGFKPSKTFGQIIKTADVLRDERGMKREDVLFIISENKNESQEKVLEKLKEKLK